VVELGEPGEHTLGLSLDGTEAEPVTVTVSAWDRRAGGAVLTLRGRPLTDRPPGHHPHNERHERIGVRRASQSVFSSLLAPP
jgi:hypothetical protein